MKSTRIIAVLLALGMVFGLCACGSPNDNTGASPGSQDATPSDAQASPSGISTLTENEIGDLVHTTQPWFGGDLDLYTTSAAGGFEKQTPADTIIVGDSNAVYPAEPGASADRIHAYNCYDSLLEFDRVTGELKPLLATEWSYDDQGALHLTLREGVKFHDGTDFTADDVMYTFTRDANSTYAPKVYTIFQNVDFDKSVIEDDYHLVIVFKKAVPTFLTYLATGFTGIYSKDFMEKNGEDYGFVDGDAGCGAYYLAETVTGSSQTFKRFADYWAGAGSIETIVYRYYADQSTMFIDYENGAIDMAINNNYDAVNRVLGGECTDTQIMCALMPRTNSLYLQSIAAPLDDVRVRQAIAYAIDVDGVLIAAYQSEMMGKSATSILPDGCQYKVNLGVHEYNPDKAKELLQAAGYTDANPLRITMQTSNVYTNQVLMEAVQGYLQAVGIDAELIIEEQNTATARQNEQTGVPSFDIIQNMTPLASYDPDEYLSYRAAFGKEPGKFSDLRGIQDEHISELIKKGGISTDPVERAAVYKELQELIGDGAYVIPLVQPANAIIMRTYLKGTEFYSSRVPLFRYWTIDEG